MKPSLVNLRNKAIVYVAILVGVVWPSYFISRGILGVVNGAVFTFESMQWWAWVIAIGLTLVLAVVLLALLVQMVLFFMVALKR